MMILRKLQSNPARMVSVAMTLLAIGMTILGFAILWPRLPFPANLWPERNDFLHGVTFGIAIGLDAIAVVICAREQRRTAQEIERKSQ